MKRLYRSRSEVMIAGVCAGLADYLNVDPTIIRLIFVLLFFAGGGGLFIYLVLWVIVPLEPASASDAVEVQEKSAEEAPKEVEAPKAEKTKKTSTSKGTKKS